MEKAFVVFVLVIVFANMLADGPIRDFFNWIWFGFWVLFSIFLIIFYHMDHRGMFTPDKIYKKRNKED